MSLLQWDSCGRGFLLKLGIVVCLVATTSCDDTIDVSNVNTDITVGGQIAVPIGETETLTLERLIDLTDELIVDESGAYAIQTNGQIGMDVQSVDVIAVKNLTPAVRTVVLDLGYDSSLPDIPISENLNIPFADNMHSTATVDIPVEVKSISRISFETPIDAYIHVQAMDKNGNPISGFQNMSVEDMTFVLPDIFVVQDGVDGFDYTTNTLTLDKVAFSDGEIRVPVGIVGIKDLPAVENCTMTIDETINVTGKFLATVNNVYLSELNGMRLIITYRIPDAVATKLEGVFSTDIDINETMISLGELPEIVQDENTKININKMALTIDVENPEGVPFFANIKLQPLDKNGQRINKAVDVSLRVKPAADYDVPTVSRFFVTNSAELVAPEGFEKVLVEDLKDLIVSVPSALQVTTHATIDESVEHFLKLGVAYDSKINYNIALPFDFNEGSQIVYRESIDGLNADIEDVANMVTNMMVKAEFENNIPLALNIEVAAYDLQGNNMNDRLDYTDKIEVDAYDPQNPANSNSEISIKVKEGHEGALKDLERVDFVITAVTKGASSILRPDQTLVVRMKAYLPEGITITDDEE